MEELDRMRDWDKGFITGVVIMVLVSSIVGTLMGPLCR